jgi:hypothetical protein
VPDITQLSSGQPIFFAVAFFLVSNPYLAAIVLIIIAADIGTFILAVNY